MSPGVRATNVPAVTKRILLPQDPEMGSSADGRIFDKNVLALFQIKPNFICARLCDL
jgi:hypothetical protein